MTDNEYSWPSQVVVERDQRIERQLLHRVVMQRCSSEVRAAWARTLEARAAAGRTGVPQRPRRSSRQGQARPEPRTPDSVLGLGSTGQAAPQCAVERALEEGGRFTRRAVSPGDRTPFGGAPLGLARSKTAIQLTGVTPGSSSTRSANI